MVIEYYDELTEKDENKEYKLVRKVSMDGTILLYYKSIKKVVDKEKEELKAKVEEMDKLIEDLMITIMDLVP